MRSLTGDQLWIANSKFYNRSPEIKILHTKMQTHMFVYFSSYSCSFALSSACQLLTARTALGLLSSKNKQTHNTIHTSQTMPNTRNSVKRKVPEASANAPPASSKTKKTKSTSLPPARAASSAASATSIASRFVSGLAAQLAADQRSVAVVKSSFREALAVLPEGKLKAELLRDEAATVQRLAAEVRAIGAKDKPGTASGAGSGAAAAAAGTPARREVTGRPGRSAARGKASKVTPWTAGLHDRARPLAEKHGNSAALRSSALNPRAPVHLLVDATEIAETDAMDVGDAASPPLAAPLESAVDNMRNLTRALATDPRPGGLAFFTDRAATLASAASGAALAAKVATGGDGEGLKGATEALGLMLRMLQVSGLAAVTPTPDEAPAVDPAHALLLPCLPRPTEDVVLGKGGVALPPSRRSVARLLAHYSLSLAAYSATEKGGAPALVKGAQSVAAGGRGGCGERGIAGQVSSSNNSSSSDNSSDEEEESGAGPGAGRGTAALSQHLLTLSVGHLRGDETATLEFLRCVGDACFASPPAGSGLRQQSLLAAVADSLAPMCARALARLRRPSASPAPTPAQFLRRAYAYRVVKALVVGDATAVRLWDFVGAAAAPRALLDFLGRPEAPVAVGGGPAGAALAELASRRDSPPAIGELLRSSAACAPSALGPLLSTMERLVGVGEGVMGHDSGGGGGNGKPDDSAVVGGFFVDTEGSGGGGDANVILAPLRGGSNGKRRGGDAEE